VAAVAMTAAARTGAPAARRSTRDIDPGRHLPAGSDDTGDRGVPLRQSLLYLIEPDRIGGMKISAWVLTAARSDGDTQFSARPFVPRIGASEDQPRFVTAQDLEMFEMLVQPSDRFMGVAGFDVLRHTILTGRAFWRSLESRPLREGGARPVPFAWQTRPNGSQRLCSGSPKTLECLLQFEPPVYIDTASGECGPIGLPYPSDLLRRYCHRPAVEPEDVGLENARLAGEPGARHFPRLRDIKVERHLLATLLPRLTLIGKSMAAEPKVASSGSGSTVQPAAALHWIYNGIAVNADPLVDTDALGANDRLGDTAKVGDDELAVRHQQGDIVHHIVRNVERERAWRAQLDGAMRDTPWGAAAWLTFMMDGVPALRASGWDVVVDSSFPYQLAAADDWYADLRTPVAPRRGSSNVGGRSRDWFDLELGVIVDGHCVNLLPALADHLRGAAGGQSAGARDAGSFLIGEQLLVRLDDGRYLPVPLERIHRIGDVLVELLDRDSLNDRRSLPVRTDQTGRLAELAFGTHPPALRSDDPALLDRVGAFESLSKIEPVAAPAGLQATLRPYQAEGLGWLQFLRRHGLGGILADDMGLGKTVQTLAHLLLEREAGRLRRPSLIVAPVSVLGNWVQEIRRFAPGLASLIIQGTRRGEALAAIESADIILIGYPLLLIESETLLRHEFCFVILDEAQTIKNPQTQVSQVARALRAEHRLCLTGTPMENHLGELWSLCEFVQPGLLGDRSAFQRHYRTPIEKGGNASRAAALSQRVRPFLLRRTKDAVARDLPAKVQIVEVIDFDDLQRDFYDGIRLGQHRRVRAAIEDRGLERSRITVLDALLKLRQACCDPRLVSRDPPSQRIPSAKLDWLATTLPELIAEGRRILLFSQFTSMLHLIEALVKDLSIPHCVLTGKTRGRTELVRRFQAGAVPLFLISLKAGGTGLNLTAADTVIHYDPWWNPMVEAQATDRAHRIGQQRTVFVYKLIARRTVEEKIMQLQSDKQALVNQLLADAGALPAPLDRKEFEALFEP
jgi:superfamily II DNA or RNA helicase